jgi:hypothetical protein
VTGPHVGQKKRRRGHVTILGSHLTPSGTPPRLPVIGHLLIVLMPVLGPHSLCHGEMRLRNHYSPILRLSPATDGILHVEDSHCTRFAWGACDDVRIVSWLLIRLPAPTEVSASPHDVMCRSSESGYVRCRDALTVQRADGRTYVTARVIAAFVPVLFRSQLPSWGWGDILVLSNVDTILGTIVLTQNTARGTGACCAVCQRQGLLRTRSFFSCDGPKPASVIQITFDASLSKHTLRDYVVPRAHGNLPLLSSQNQVALSA